VHPTAGSKQEEFVSMQSTIADSILFAVALFVFSVLGTALACGQEPNSSSSATRGAVPDDSSDSLEPSAEDSEQTTMLATFGGGCFWCVEAIFERLQGVHSVESGYTGGTIPDPIYEEVCSGKTGHAEVVQITYDPNLVSFEKLLEVFFKTHDPTTLNRQGPDHGTQYRSAIFYHDDEQRQIAERVKKALNDSGAFARPIVTEIVPATTFYPAEKYHQDYFNQNPDAKYCQYSIRPKVEKFEKVFADIIKENAK
jgi:peptide-methionine (S)-S-oxide reductase